MLAAI
jgi:hypothetical protein